MHVELICLRASKDQPTLVVSAMVPHALGAKVVLDLHDPMPELMMTIFGLEATSLAVRLLKRLERWSIAFADVVFVVNLVRTQIFASRSCGPDKIQVVMNSSQEEIFTLHPPAPPPLKRPGRFVIMYHADSTPFLEIVMDTERRTGVSDAVRYFGRKDLEDIVAAIGECDVGSCPIVGRSSRRSIRRPGTSSICREASPRSRGAAGVQD